MADDPFMPPIPRANELGRLVTHGALAGGWTCRWCYGELNPTTGRPNEPCLICAACDRGETMTA